MSQKMSAFMAVSLSQWVGVESLSLREDTAPEISENGYIKRPPILK